MPWWRFDLIIKEDKSMGGWLIFCFGGIIGFCLGVICLILLMAIGESEMCVEQLDVGEE
jgi:hypothetical protein